MDTCQIYIVFTFNFVVILTRCGLIGFFLLTIDISLKARTARNSCLKKLGPFVARSNPGSDRPKLGKLGVRTTLVGTGGR